MLRKLFIDENCHVEFYENEIILRDKEKNLEEKLQGGKSYDVFRVKNSELLAYVCTTHDSVSIPLGTTNLIDMANFEEVHKMEVPLSKKSLMLDCGILIGIYGQKLLLNELKTQSDVLFDDDFIIKELIPITKNSWAMINPKETDIYSALNNDLGSLYFEHLYYSDIGSLEKVIGLSQGRFLAQIKMDFSFEFRLYTHEDKFKVSKSRLYQSIIDFKDFVFVLDQNIVLGLTNKGEIYSIQVDDLQMEKVDVDLPKKMDNFYLNKNNQLFAVFEDGNYLELHDKNDIFQQLRQEKGLQIATVVLNIIAEYAASIRFFPKIIKKDNADFKENYQLKIK